MPSIRSSPREIYSDVSTRESPKELIEAAKTINTLVDKLKSARFPEEMRQVKDKEEGLWFLAVHLRHIFTQVYPKLGNQSNRTI